MKDLAKSRIRSLGMLSIAMTIASTFLIVGYSMYANSVTSDIESFWNAMMRKEQNTAEIIGVIGLAVLLICWVCAIVYGSKVLLHPEDFMPNAQKQAILVGIFAIFGSLMFVNAIICFMFPRDGYAGTRVGRKATEMEILKNQVAELQKQVETKKGSKSANDDLQK